MCDTGVVEFQYRTEVDDDEGAIKYMFDHIQKMSKHMRGRQLTCPGVRELFFQARTNHCYLLCP
jgi:hypothetical protein